jgi:hypothetical protein
LVSRENGNPPEVDKLRVLNDDLVRKTAHVHVLNQILVEAGKLVGVRASDQQPDAGTGVVYSF